jgi:hypothetical protein
MIKEILFKILLFTLAIVCCVSLWLGSLDLFSFHLTTFFIVGVLFLIERKTFQESRTARITAGLVILTSLIIGSYDGLWSKLIYTSAMALMIGYLQRRELRFLYFGIVIGILNIKKR